MKDKLKECKTWKKEVAKSAKKCPHCGARLKRGPLFKLFIGIIIVFCIQVLWGFGSSVKRDYDKAAIKYELNKQ